MVEKADMADSLLLELEEERSRWLFIILIVYILKLSITSISSYS